jgi:hypothetical protein
MFILKQNNAKGGYNVGDKTDQASTQEDQQFNMVSLQSAHEFIIFFSAKNVIQIRYASS